MIAIPPNLHLRLILDYLNMNHESGVINVYQGLMQSPSILGCLRLGTMADEKRNRGLIVAISTFLVQYVIGCGLIEVNRSSNFSNTITSPAY